MPSKSYLFEARLPLQLELAPGHAEEFASNISTFMLIESIDHPVVANEDNDAVLRLEAKLDIVIQMMNELLGHHQSKPALHDIKIANEQVAIKKQSDDVQRLDNEAAQQEDPKSGVLRLFLDPRVPGPIIFPVEITEDIDGWLNLNLNIVTNYNFN